MKPTEFTLSPETSAAIEARLRPFLDRKINGKPISQWLMRPRRELTSRDVIPPDIRIALAATLEDVLATSGGPEGLQLLEALDGIINGGGKPAIMIHGLPTAPDIAPILREAFRLKMFPDISRPYEEQLEIQDLTLGKYGTTGFHPSGTCYFHVDDADIGLLFGIDGGTNPRHTELMTVPDLVDQIVAYIRGNGEPIKQEDVIALLKKPLWPISIPGLNLSQPNKNNEALVRNQDHRLNVAQSIGKLHVDADGKAYGPLIYDNPSFHPEETDSQPYIIMDAPFAQFAARLHTDSTALSPNESWLLYDLVEAIGDAINSAPSLKKGPVVQAGDLLVFNNRLLFHSGGGFAHANLPEEIRRDASNLRSRTIYTLDVQAQPSEQYPVKPGDRVTSPIKIGMAGSAPTISRVNFSG